MSIRKITLNKLHVNQEKVLTERKRFNTLSCGRRWGKTTLSENLLVPAALEGSPVAYYAPTYKLLNDVFRTIIKTVEPITLHSDATEKRIELITGGIIDFWSLQNRFAGRGRKYRIVVVDEAAFVKDLEECWQEAIRPTLTDLKGDAWFLSTPKGKNFFHRLYMRGKQGDEGWASWQMSTYDNPYMDPSEIDDAKRDLPALAFSQEYMAEFNDNVANPFGTAFIAQCTYPLSNEPAVCYGIDLAKSFDFTVIIGIDKNGSVCHFDRFQKDWRQTVNTILELPSGADIALDSTGVGDPIGEDVCRVRHGVEMFQFTSKSKQQIMEGLAVGIQQRKITFPEGIITDELNNFEYQFTRTGVKYTAPAGLHDDCVCALALAWHKWQTSHTSGQLCYI